MSPLAFDQRLTTHRADDHRAEAVDAVTPSMLLFPDGLLDGERYFIVTSQASSMAQSVLSLLQWASPRAVCLGMGDAPPSHATRVFVEPDALAQICRTRASEDVALESIRLMPIPFGYPWAFWDTWAIFAGHPEVVANPRSFDAFRHFFCESPYLGGASNVERVTTWNARRDESLYWTEARGAFESRSRELRDVRSGLADDHSRVIFDLALESDPEQLWRHYVSTVFATTDYLIDDAPAAGEHVLNLGVFTGHEMPYLSALVGSRGVIHNIDPVGFDLLSDYVRRCVETTPHRFTEARFAAAASSGTARFRSYPDGQVCLDAADSSSRSFPTATIDDYVRAAGIPKVGFVKIDIEGMEFDALDGMRDIIQRDRPTISLAIYHQADHLWRIPLQLMTTLRGYRFYVSHSSPVRWETVLTAVPDERPWRGLRRR